ncbi:MAG: methylated-DNA--[protein]-cysteine S-methyltransferase [Parvularculaceae bacterium]|nr:methylated-DNA--[protein]-cysteine S-methyltransferase [Parvularculaceae bacterium]
MTAPTCLAAFETAFGVAALAWRADAIVGLGLPGAREGDSAAWLRRRHPDAMRRAPEGPALAAIEGVVATLAGRPADLRGVPIDLSALDDLSARALGFAREIPFGETATYGAIARRLGDVALARRVGQAMGRNPVPIIIPCHRILGEGGKLVGFSAPGGLDLKLRLLDVEGALRPALFPDLKLSRRGA